ncbi:hypothetical protein FOZ62_014828 [Perkinsus olseni]|uniref:Uncharacterized protein n=1 Tax=Perkinsus olseni TaxID=32597 RepID=A0A7J6PUN0_PEROL|nr:hypothetical protein FOZ62_014828 [Perkinsus olseni]
MLEAHTHDVVEEIRGLTAIAREVSPKARSRRCTVKAATLPEAAVNKVLCRPSASARRYVRRGPAVPEEVEIVKFVDDFYVGGANPEEARVNYTFTTHIFAGHHLQVDPKKEFVSWGGTPPEEDGNAIHTLGYRFDPGEGTLRPTFAADVPTEHEKVTKRRASALLSSLYDPLGLVLEHDISGRVVWRI